ncbi:hypothetical protein PST407_04052 [Pseudomonas syringae pv. tomato]|nr:hypothetical protein PST407_04052 [Pseudomonas syringae pv. tomato]KUR48287.1 hypothetical protein PSTA9_01057 [Pseudomonas syringae pv. tomato]RMQ79131.1 hypothetical protein ALQ00_200029 [Pseudomonas syringae pv. tomato]
MSSSIGLSAVILGCFGTAWAAARQQIGLLVIASYPCCIRRHTLLAVFDCEPSCTVSRFRACPGCYPSAWRFPKAEPTNHPKAFYLRLVRSCLLARGWRACIARLVPTILKPAIENFTIAVACFADFRLFHGLSQSYRRTNAFRDFIEFRNGCGAKINAQLERQNIEIALNVGKLSRDIWQRCF